MNLRPSTIRKLAVLAGVGAVAGSLAVGATAAGDSASVAANKRVSVRDDVFSPRTVRVGVGDKVTWVWRGSNPHNVKFRRVPSGGGKRSSSTKTSGRFARTFRKRGTYRYVCTIHVDSGMRGTVKAG